MKAPIVGAVTPNEHIFSHKPGCRLPAVDQEPARRVDLSAMGK